MNKKPAAGHAELPRKYRESLLELRQRFVEVRIIEQDHRRLATEFTTKSPAPDHARRA